MYTAILVTVFRFGEDAQVTYVGVAVPETQGLNAEFLLVYLSWHGESRTVGCVGPLPPRSSASHLVVEMSPMLPLLSETSVIAAMPLALGGQPFVSHLVPAIPVVSHLEGTRLHACAWEFPPRSRANESFPGFFGRLMPRRARVNAIALFNAASSPPTRLLVFDIFLRSHTVRFLVNTLLREPESVIPLPFLRPGVLRAALTITGPNANCLYQAHEDAVFRAN